MVTIEDIENLAKAHIKRLSDNHLRICHNEFFRRWRIKHKDKVNSYKVNWRKKDKLAKQGYNIPTHKKNSVDNIPKANLTKVNEIIREGLL